VPATSTPKPPEHPAVRSQRRLLAVFLALSVLVGVSQLVGQGVGEWLAAPLFALAGWFGWVMWRLPRQGRAVQLYNGALARLLRGHDDDAVSLLDQLPPAEIDRGALAVGARTVRAIIAFHRGDSAEAASLTTAALARKGSRWPFARPHEDLHRAKATAMRALALASVGRETEALADAAAAETMRGATPDTVARAALARAVVMARQNDRPALAAHLRQSSGVMLEWLTPRERSLVRAFRLMARAQARSVYRESARVVERREQEELASWMGKLVPGAEAFARVAPASTAPESMPPASAPVPGKAIDDVRRAHKKKLKMGVQKFGVLWLVLVVGFVALWQLLSPGPAERGRHPVLTAVTTDAGPASILVAVFAFAVAAMMALMWRQQRRSRDLSAAYVMVARGEIGEATARLERLTGGRVAGVAAAAHLVLARLAERALRWSDALRHAEAGASRLIAHAALRATYSDHLLPDLLATRAFALAATDRPDEARAEMSVVASDYPAYISMGTADLRTRLLLAVRAGDLPAASRLARTRSADMPLSLRDDMLADVALAATTEMAADERERIDAELSDDPELRAWIDAVAPGLRQQSRKRVAGKVADVTDEAAEEPEAVEQRRAARQI
jgi:hypothetical protein